jgi:UDP-N-acetylglucosamine 2-epimerase (non-hydrolysing)
MFRSIGMNKLKILHVVGTRPEAIKLAPVILEAAKFPTEIDNLVCSTAQHREMLDEVLRLFSIVPDFDLDVMQENQTPNHVAATVIRRMDDLLRSEKPDWVVVQGDTTTVAAASLAAFYLGTKVAHVEAGLRSFNKREPFPEEVNRRIAGVVADMHFAPTALARENLLREGIPADSIQVTGNTVIDALLQVSELPFNETVAGIPSPSSDSRLVLVTAHRRENWGQPLEGICLALSELAKVYKGRIQIVYPVHPNPNVRQVVQRLLGGIPNVVLTGPLAYLPFVQLMKRAYVLVTDSGGLQEEGPALHKPVLVLRNVTERPEGVEAGGVKVIGVQRENIVKEVSRLLDDSDAYQQMASVTNPYGDGLASQRIIRALLAGR